ncbi:MAG: CopG family transcriptional regulator [Acidobacteriota bacterium]
MAEIEINLTEKQHRALRQISQLTGKTEDELVHDAVENLIRQGLPSGKPAMVQARGIWRDRNDLPDFKKLRRELDRL